MSGLWARVQQGIALEVRERASLEPWVPMYPGSSVGIMRKGVRVPYWFLEISSQKRTDPWEAQTLNPNRLPSQTSVTSLEGIGLEEREERRWKEATDVRVSGQVALGTSHPLLGPALMTQEALLKKKNFPVPHKHALGHWPLGWIENYLRGMVWGWEGFKSLLISC